LTDETIGATPKRQRAPLRRERAAPLGGEGRRKLFCTLDGCTLKQSYVRHLLRRLAMTRRALSAGFIRHALRHTYSAEWLARARQ
jgi:hypothetical protein